MSSGNFHQSASLPNPSLKRSTVGRAPSPVMAVRGTLASPGLAPCRHCPLSSNVRPHTETAVHCPEPLATRTALLEGSTASIQSLMDQKPIPFTSYDFWSVPGSGIPCSFLRLMR